MWWTICGVAGALGVAFGAFGAHSLPQMVSEELLADAARRWDLAARYHLVHALALGLVALHPNPPTLAGGLFVAGMVLFSGSLYTMALTNQTWLGAVTPLGGLSWIAAWLVLAFASRTA
ncbi:MAG: DUF423 domain-containing protein [Myxococcota bacterium]